jgi:hypothetical protein
MRSNRIGTRYVGLHALFDVGRAAFCQSVTSDSSTTKVELERGGARSNSRVVSAVS